MGRLEICAVGARAGGVVVVLLKLASHRPLYLFGSDSEGSSLHHLQPSLGGRCRWRFRSLQTYAAGICLEDQRLDGIIAGFGGL